MDLTLAFLTFIFGFVCGLILNPRVGGRGPEMKRDPKIMRYKMLRVIPKGTRKFTVIKGGRKDN